jgi:hypothetical protein
MFGQGLDRLWLRQDKEDFWIRELQDIGAQQVLEQELFANSANAGNVFGYSDRYDEYRRQRSLVTAEFRDTYDYWHLAQIYGSAPTLNETFVQCSPSKRIFNEQTNNSLLMAIQHSLVARREVSRRANTRIL